MVSEREIERWLEEVEDALPAEYREALAQELADCESDAWTSLDEDQGAEYTCFAFRGRRRGTAAAGQVFSLGLWLDPAWFSDNEERWARGSGAVLSLTAGIKGPHGPDALHAHEAWVDTLVVNLRARFPDLAALDLELSYPNLEPRTLLTVPATPRLVRHRQTTVDGAPGFVDNLNHYWIEFAVDAGPSLDALRPAAEVAQALSSSMDGFRDVINFVSGALSTKVGSLSGPNLTGWCAEYVAAAWLGDEYRWCSTGAPYDLATPDGRQTVEVKGSEGAPPIRVSFTANEISHASGNPRHRVLAVGVPGEIVGDLKRLLEQAKRVEGESLPPAGVVNTLYVQTGVRLATMAPDDRAQLDALLERLCKSAVVSEHPNPWRAGPRGGLAALSGGRISGGQIQVELEPGLV